MKRKEKKKEMIVRQDNGKTEQTKRGSAQQVCGGFGRHAACGALLARVRRQKKKRKNMQTMQNAKSYKQIDQRKGRQEM